MAKKTLSNIIDKITNIRTLCPCPAEDIAEAEKQLGLTFADDYKAYTLHYGAISSPYFAMTGVVHPDGYNVVKRTKALKSLYTLSDDVYAIFFGKFGVIALQDSNGTIYIMTSDSPPTPVYNSLAEFLDVFGNVNLES